MPPHDPTSPTGIQWNKVTWYSQLLAVVLAVSIFVSGYFLGTQSVPGATPDMLKEQTDSFGNKDTSPKSTAQTEIKWVEGAGYDLDNLIFEYPEHWKVTQHGTNQSDEATSAIFVEGDGESAIFLQGGEAALIDGCKGVTFLSNEWSPTIERIFKSAKCLGYNS